MIDFDSIDEWEPALSEVLDECVSAAVRAQIRKASPEYIEDARRSLLTLADRDAVIDATLLWLRSSVLCVYHGTRLTDEELALVQVKGLVPLEAKDRRLRLDRALSAHPRWSEARGNLDNALHRHGPGERAGRRESQVHLTLSRSGLASGFNHYLTHGSEFDQHVAHSLLAQEGVEMLRRDGKARILKFAVPGADALNAAHPYFTVDDVRYQGDTPNIVSEFLEAWSYRLAHPNFQCRTLEVDCGLVFRAAVPAAWLMDVETLSI